MAKAADAFRTISEVAEELDVPKHVLRFWEIKFPQVRPMKRGGGRRYYRPEDVDLLRGIRELLHSDGYTIKGVQKILREHGAEFVKAGTQSANLTERASPGTKGRAKKSAPQAQSAKVVTLPTVTAGIIADALQELEICRNALMSGKLAKPKTKARRSTRSA